MDTAVYLFCLTPGGSLSESDVDCLGDGAALATSEVAHVAAVVSEVPLSEYCGESAESNLQDLAWVGPRALRHAEIIEWVRSRAPVLPSRFGTLFSSMESLQALLARNSSTINSFLDAVSGKDEWSVKVRWSKASLTEKLFTDRLADQAHELERMAPGLRYFRERQLRSTVEKEVGGWLNNVLTASATELARHSADWSKREILGTEKDKDRIVVANWAFLVDREKEDDFSACIVQANSEHDQNGIFFEVSGPWPPYSFTPALNSEHEK